jgi:hypothetical protein
VVAKKPDFVCVVEKNKNTDEAKKTNCKKTSGNARLQQ